MLQQHRDCIITHGVSGVDCRFYKHALPDNVYDVYMQYWKNVDLTGWARISR
jgi:hypothetical protein